MPDSRVSNRVGTPRRDHGKRLMKRLFLLRHAKAVPAESGIEDFARTLMLSGMQDAGAMARYLRKGDYRVELILSSSAARTAQTGELVVQELGCEIEYRDALYLAEPSKILAVAQPTWGLDVGAAAEIRNHIAALAAGGVAVLVISEDLPELFELCTDLVVLARGRLSPRIPVREATVAQIGQWMSGLFPGPASSQKAETETATEAATVAVRPPPGAGGISPEAPGGV